MISVKMKNFYEFLDEFILPTLEEVKAFDLEEEIRKRNERERKKAMGRLEEYVEKQDEEKYAVVKKLRMNAFGGLAVNFLIIAAFRVYLKMRTESVLI